jgi:hypothetical protein
VAASGGAVYGWERQAWERIYGEWAATVRVELVEAA